MSEVKVYLSAGHSDAEMDEPCPCCGDPLPEGQQLWYIADGEALDPEAEEWAYCSPECARAAADRAGEPPEEGWYLTAKGVYYVTSAGRIWMIRHAEFGGTPREVVSLPLDASPSPVPPTGRDRKWAIEYGLYPIP